MKSQTPLVSIVVPVYNAEKYLSKCIESVLNQTFFDWELILVNDGSIDDSALICESYKNKDKRIVVINKKNEGVGQARNEGMDKAKGIYLCFLDADDWLNDRTLEIAWRESNGAFFDLIQFGCIRFIDESKIISYRVTPNIEINLNNQDNSSLISLFEAGNAYAVWGKLIKRDVILKNDLWFGNKKRGQDIDFTIRAYQYIKYIKGISDCLYNYRVLYNVSSKYDPMIIENHIQNYIQFNNLFTDCQRNVIVQNYMAKLYLLWFTIVIPINISGNKKLSINEKIKEFKRLFENNPAKEIYLNKKRINLKGKFKFLSFVYSINSPILLFFFSSMLQKVRSKLNLTN